MHVFMLNSPYLKVFLFEWFLQWRGVCRVKYEYVASWVLSLWPLHWIWYANGGFLHWPDCLLIPFSFFCSSFLLVPVNYEIKSNVSFYPFYVSSFLFYFHCYFASLPFKVCFFTILLLLPPLFVLWEKKFFEIIQSWETAAENQPSALMLLLLIFLLVGLLAFSFFITTLCPFSL